MHYPKKYRKAKAMFDDQNSLPLMQCIGRHFVSRISCSACPSRPGQVVIKSTYNCTNAARKQKSKKIKVQKEIIVWRSVSSVTSSKIIWPVLFCIDNVNFIQISLQQTKTYHTKNPSVYLPNISGQGGVESQNMIPRHIGYQHKREEYGLDLCDVDIGL